MRALILTTSFLLFCTLAIPQATVNQLYTLSAVKGDAGLANGNVILDAPLTLTRDATGHVHQGISTTPMAFGKGFAVATSGASIQVFLDTSYVSYRTTAPTGPGPCSNTIAPDQNEGTAVWAIDQDGYFYACNDSRDAPGVFVWYRLPTPMVATW